MFRNWVTDTYISADRNVASGGIFMGSPQGVQREGGQIVEMSVGFDNFVQMSMRAAEMCVTIFLVF